MDPVAEVLIVVLAVELIVAIAFVVLRIVFPPPPPLDSGDEHRERVPRANRDREPN